MSTLAITLVLISAITHASRDFFTKRSEDKQVFMWWFSAVSVLINIPMVLWVLTTQGTPNSTGILIGVCVSVIHFLYWFSLSKALEHGDLSHVYPIVRSSPALVLIAALIFFGETASMQGVAGILLVVLGAYAINLKSVTLRGIAEPIITLKHNQALQYALIALMTVVIYTVVDDRGVDFLHPILYFFIANTLSWLWFTVYVFKVKERRLFSRVWKSSTKSILINGVIGLASYLLMLFAYRMEPASYVAGLRQLSIVFAVLLGGHILQEKHKEIRLGAALTIFIGAILIALAS